MPIDMHNVNAPPKLYLLNLDTFDQFEAQLNPSEIKEQLSAKYTRLTVPGLGHQPLQFSSTGNFKINFELFMRAEQAEDAPFMAQVRRFLFAWMSPRQAANDILGGSPP